MFIRVKMYSVFTVKSITVLVGMPREKKNLNFPEAINNINDL